MVSRNKNIWVSKNFIDLMQREKSIIERETGINIKPSQLYEILAKRYDSRPIEIQKRGKRFRIL